MATPLRVWQMLEECYIPKHENGREKLLRFWTSASSLLILKLSTRNKVVHAEWSITAAKFLKLQSIVLNWSFLSTLGLTPYIHSNRPPFWAPDLLSNAKAHKTYSAVWLSVQSTPNLWPSRYCSTTTPSTSCCCPWVLCSAASGGIAVVHYWLKEVV